MASLLRVVLVLILLAGAAKSQAASQVIITEFMASNSRTLADEDGSFEDWIELFNAGASTVNLFDWSLTDAAGDLNKWRFPATNLAAGNFLVVFASGKDRATAGSNLHTNFRLGAGGEYLALVEPDGVTIASQFAPVFPPQATDVSFGFGVQSSSTFPITTGSAARVFVPASDALGMDWIASTFDDSGWLAATNGVGFDTGVPDPNEDSYALAVAASGPIAWYRFEETSGTSLTNTGSLGAAAASTNLNLALNRSGPRPAQFGGFETNNRAPSFNGFSGRVRVPDHAAFNFGSGAYSIEMWFNAVNAATRGDLFTYKGPEGDFGIHVASQGANTLSLYHGAFIGTGGGISNNVWYHLVVTRAASGQVAVYLNGAVLFTGNDTATMNISNDLLIGSNHTGTPATGSLFFNGLIDEVAIYNRALSASETTGHYQRALSGGAGYASEFLTDLQSALHGVNSSAFIRIPFTITNVAVLDRLLLRMKYDDGFTAWINGQEIVSRNAPATLAWDSAATDLHGDGQAVVYEDFEVSDFRDFVRVGDNVLAIQGLNIAAGNADFLIVAGLVATDIGGLNPEPRYFLLPTPGAVNGVGASDVGPIIADARHAPALPARPGNDDDIVVTARVAPAFAAVTGVTMSYRVMYGTTNTLALLDDGAHGDGPAGDGVFGATIPASASTNGQMVRWIIRATDALGRSSRWPLFEDPLGSPEYLGTVVANMPNVTSTLPIYEWFTADVANSTTRTGSRASVLFNGEFFDNVFVRVRGSATTSGQKFDFNRGQHVQINDTVGRVEEVNLNGPGSDATYLRPPLAFETFRIAGNVSGHSFHMLMRRNGAADRVGIFIEQPDDEYLELRGLDPEGALYKFDQRGSLNPVFSDSTDGVQKRTRRDEDNSDLQALVNGLNLTNQTQRIAHFFDNVNVPNLINYVAVRAINMDSDDVRKNFYMYRDTRGNGEWSILPWDKDWTYGIEGDGGTFLHHPFFGDQFHAKQNANQYSVLWTVMFNDPPTREMYLRRLRTLMDQYLQPPGTPAANGWFEQRVDQWYLSVSNAIPGIAGGVAALKNWFPTRRTDLFVTYSVTNTARPVGDRWIPAAQPINAGVNLGGIEFNPSSGNQAQEYVCLTNTLPFAVDISGWRLEGAVQHTFAAGTVVRSNNVIYASPDVNAFRARILSPRGGQGLFVQGNYQGQLSARGETIRLIDQFGNTRQEFDYPGAPSAAQQFLRITEIMYHPSPLAGNTNSPEAFEFIELRNISTNATLDLTGVRFVNGIDFNFAGSAVTSLAPGARVVVVRNPAAFTARYGGGVSVAGQFTGALENRGERIQLLDASNEEILDFSYNNSWYPMTDGQGFSLVAVNDNAEPESWDSRAQWRASGALTGTPAANDPGAPAIAAVRINEALTRSDVPPPTDSIELFNPTAGEANIGGWFLSDDFNSPKKFRILDGTTMAAGAYRVFTEADFNPGGTGFALSSDSDEVWLFSADTVGNLTGYFHGFDFGAAEDGVTFGRHVTSAGEEHFVAQASRTIGIANAGPMVGPIVINEIMYRPPDLADGSDNSADEFIELLNISGASVPLFDPANPANTWRLSGGVDFVFPTNRSLANGGLLLLVNFDPINAAQLSSFRARFGVAPGVPILGPYSGKLSNDGDDVEIKKPTTPLPAGVPYVLVDKVSYRDSVPWPGGADGYGLSLQRRVSTAYGNDPANWMAAQPTAAAASPGAGNPPIIVTQPQSQTVVAFSSASLNVAAGGDGPLRYQWRFNGANLPGATNSILFLNNIQPQQSGDYACLVINAAGSAVSTNAVLSIIYGAAVLAQPQGISIRGSTNAVDYGSTTNRSATFSVAAYSPSPISYQWRFNGIPIPGATSPALTVSNVTLAQDGLYDAVLTDAIGSFTSVPARLTVLLTPIITQPPVNQTVVEGSDFTMSVELTGNPLPMAYSWRRGSLIIVSNYGNFRSNFITLNTTTAGLTLASNMPSSNYTMRLVVYNEANNAPGVLVVFTNTVLADFDRDGIPDAAEHSLGLATNNAADAALDLDGDGLSNRAEYVAGTDPTAAASYLKIEQGITPGMATVRVAAVSNRTYTVQFTDNLNSGLWRRLADIVARANNRVETILDPAWTTNRFYRLVLPAQP